MDIDGTADTSAKLHDLVWILARACAEGDVTMVRGISDDEQCDTSQHDQSVPGWTAFNVLCHKSNVPERSTIAYCPVVNASPTDMSTVLAIVQKCQARCAAAGLPFCIIVTDQAIYAKAMEVILHRREEFSNVVLRLGAFHTASTLISIIGKRFKDAGLFDILVESGVGGTAAVTAALNGRQYNRGVRFIKVVAEALERLQWQEFVQTIDSAVPQLQLQALKVSLQDLQECLTDDNLEIVSSPPALHDLYRRYLQFCDEQCTRLPNFKFWSSFINMAQLLLRFIRSRRVADWTLHLSCIHQILPWCFAYDRPNYSRYLTLYWLQMTNLSNTHPEADHFLKSGGFSVQWSTCPFARVAADMAIEQSINRATKTQGGIIGFSRDPAAVQRWVLTAHERAEVTDVCLQQCGLDTDATEAANVHKECQTTRIVHDERDVVRVMSTVATFVNPFVTSEGNAYPKLVSLSSCTEASDTAAADLLNAQQHGMKEFKAFAHGRLTSSPPAAKFHDPIKKLKLETFAVKRATASGRLGRVASILRADHSVFSRIALVAQTREMNLREVLSYPLGPYPWSLATLSGTLMKTSKSALLPLLTTDVTAPAVSPSSSVLLLGMLCPFCVGNGAFHM